MNGPFGYFQINKLTILRPCYVKIFVEVKKNFAEYQVLISKMTMVKELKQDELF